MTKHHIINMYYMYIFNFRKNRQTRNHGYHAPSFPRRKVIKLAHCVIRWFDGGLGGTRGLYELFTGENYF